MSFNNDYHNLLSEIISRGFIEKNKRTGSIVKRLIGKMLKIDCSLGLPLIWTRKMRPGTMAAELAWSLTGEKSTEWLVNHTKIWQSFESSPGIIDESYGHLWRDKYGRDQLLDSIMLAKLDPSARQNLVIAWNPAEHGLMNIGKHKNVPCPFAYQILINNKINIILYLRSSDAFLGLPYDIGMYSLLLHAYSKSLGIPCGELTVMLGDCHLYENQFNHAAYMVENFHANKDKIETENLQYTRMSIELIPDYKDRYVEEIKKAKFVNLDFDPKVSVVL